jgi:hypothetical protein
MAFTLVGVDSAMFRYALAWFAESPNSASFLSDSVCMLRNPILGYPNLK